MYMHIDIYSSNSCTPTMHIPRHLNPHTHIRNHAHPPIHLCTLSPTSTPKYPTHIAGGDFHRHCQRFNAHSTLQHAARCNTLQHAAAHCSTLQHAATHCNTLHHTAPHCTTLHHTATLIMHIACGELGVGVAKDIVPLLAIVYM